METKSFYTSPAASYVLLVQNTQTAHSGRQGVLILELKLYENKLLIFFIKKKPQQNFVRMTLKRTKKVQGPAGRLRKGKKRKCESLKQATFDHNCHYF